MDVSVQFLGGAQTVTGSKYLLEIDDFKLLVDCGLFQGLKELRLRNREALPVDVASINAVIITHAHIDHTGYLPRLFKDGFRGKVYCTEATRDLMEILLLDSAKLQEEEALFARKKGYSKHANPQPLYNTEDVKAVLPLLQAYNYNIPVPITARVSITFNDAGHILGAAIIEVFLKGQFTDKKIVFSGDLGRYQDPILHPPTPITHADILFVESTYGNRDNKAEEPDAELAAIIKDTWRRGGCLLIPAFAVGRTQSLLYFLKKLTLSKTLPDMPVYVDSPMAIRVTELYERYAADHKLGQKAGNYGPIFEFEQLQFVSEQSESINLNYIRHNAIIISASGMGEGGRILHHMYHRLPRAEDTLLLVGFQTEGTRGRRLRDGEESIKIFGEYIPVKCRVAQINGLSAHADKSELMDWLTHFKDSPKRTFIVHGEKEEMEAFSNTIRHALGWQTIIPAYLEKHRLFDHI